MWLRDFLPLQMSEARIMIFGYNSGLFSASSAKIDDIGQELLATLDAKRGLSVVSIIVLSNLLTSSPMIRCVF